MNLVKVRGSNRNEVTADIEVTLIFSGDEENIYDGRWEDDSLRKRLREELLKAIDNKLQDVFKIYEV